MKLYDSFYFSCHPHMFLTHTVQMKQQELVLIANIFTVFLTHTVQMKQISGSKETTAWNCS